MPAHEDSSHLTGEAADAGSVDLRTLTLLVQEYLKKKAVVEDLEQRLKDAKKAFNEISQESIPDALLGSGLSSISLADGAKVSVTEDVRGSISDIVAFEDFLVERGDDALLRTTLSMGKLPKEILIKLLSDISEKYDIFPDVSKTVHPQTLYSYLRELGGIGPKHPVSEMSLDALPEGMLSIYRFFKTVVKY